MFLVLLVVVLLVVGKSVLLGVSRDVYIMTSIALQYGVPLKALVEQGLKMLLKRSRCPHRKSTLRWITVPGGLPANLDISSRDNMHEWLRGET